MLDQVVAAFERQDYQTASQLLRELVKQSPHDPWVKLYLGRLQEVSGKSKIAEEIYRQLLRNQTNAKLVLQARQGLQRLENQHKETQKQAIAQATATPENQEQGYLILEAVTGERRNELAKRFAQIMQTDAYSARGILPSRAWRLYRVGEIGELQIYSQQLRQAGIPNFCTSLAEIQSIQVFQVQYFQTIQPKAIAVCQNQANQQGSLTVDWSEVQQQAEGLLPLFSQVVDLGYRDRLEWKEHIEDYSHIYDLHVPGRRCILRLQEDKYHFHQGITANETYETLRQGWNHLIANLQKPTEHNPAWKDFTVFSESLTDFISPISRIESHIRLPRSSDCYLDPAFHFYSSLALLKRLSAPPSIN